MKVALDSRMFRIGKVVGAGSGEPEITIVGKGCSPRCCWVGPVMLGWDVGISASKLLSPAIQLLRKPRSIVLFSLRYRLSCVGSVDTVRSSSSGIVERSPFRLTLESDSPVSELLSKSSSIPVSWYDNGKAKSRISSIWWPTWL